MPFYRLTAMIQFGAQPPCGFSESWDFLAADDAGAIAQGNSFPKERAALMSQDWSIIGVRLSRIAIVGFPDCKKKFEPVQTAICPAVQRGLIPSDADTPWAAVLVRVGTKQSTPSVGTVPRPRMWQLRGIPDSWWTGVLSIPGPEQAEIRKFCKYLRDQLTAGHVVPNSGCTEFGLQLYTDCCVKRISNRQIGRPFFLLRGRRASPVVSI